MFRKAKVEVIYIVKIFSVALLLSVEYSLARPNDDTTSHAKNNTPTGLFKEFEDLFIENNILNGIVQATDDRKFGQVILDALKNSPEHVAQIDAETGKQTTYKEMMDRSIRLALWMKKQGVTPNDTIVVCTHNHLDSYIPLFATFFVDAIFNGWSEDFTLYTVRRLTNLLTPKLIFTNEDAADMLVEAVTLENSSAKLIVFGQHSKLLPLSDIMNDQTQNEVNNFALVNEKSPQDVAAIVLTSGNSGFPKGAMLSNKLLLPPDAPNLSPGAVVRYMWYSTFEWITGLLFTFKTIIEKGIKIIPSSNNSIENFFQIIQKYEVNYVLMPLAIINDLANSGLPRKYDLQSLKVILTVGTKISKEILLSVEREIPHAFVGQGYGTTEAGGLLSFSRSRSKHVESAGIVAPNCKVKIVDTTSGKTLGPNENGELCTKTPSMMIGYYKKPNETKEVFDTEGWYHTGDLAYYDESGEIFIVDRIKEIMKYKGHQISPVEIEEILMSYPDVREAAVVPIPVGVDGDRPVAFIKKAPGTNITKDELMKLTSVLEDYKKLQEIYFVDTIPHLPSGKIARAELRELAKTLAKNEHES